MRTRRWIVQLMLTFLFCLNSWGINDEGWTTSYINITNGLLNNFVDDIYQDSYGFIWVSTQGGGLARYDGSVFHYFGIGSVGISLHSNFCRNVYEDRFHRLWVAFEEKTQVLDLQKAVPVTPECNNKSDERLLKQLFSEGGDRVHCDSKGAMWVLTRSHLYRLTFDDEGLVEQISTLSVTSNPMGGCLKDLDGDGSVYVSYSGTLWHVKAQGTKLQAQNLAGSYPDIANHYVTDVLKTHGRLWMATSAGLFCSDGRQWHITTDGSQLTNDFVTSLSFSENHNLLVGTLGGITIIDLNNNTSKQWNMANSTMPLSSNFVNCIFERDGVLWIGTESGGIVKITRRILQVLNYFHDNQPTSIAPNAVNSMYVEPNGTLWVGNVEGGLNRKAPDSDVFTHYTTGNSRLTHNSVSTLAADAQGRLWIGTWGGGVNLMKLDQPGEIKPLQLKPEQQALTNFVGALAYDDINKGVWIGCNDGLFFYDFKSHSLVSPFKGNLLVRGCIGAAITPDGNLWMGCINGLLQVDLRSRRSAAGGFKMKLWRNKLDKPNSDIHEAIVSCCTAKDGTLWLGSAGYGLYKKTTDKDGNIVFVNYTQKDGLPNNGVKGIAEDKNGRLWITTNNGLSVYSPKEGIFTNFDEDDGLLCSQFYYNSVVISSQGKVFLGSEKGLSIVDGMNLHKNLHGRLCFTGLTVNNQLVMPGQKYLKSDITYAKCIYLHESDRSFSIDFAALNYGSEKMGTYRYRMKGYEKDWITLPTGQHSVRYSTLPAGDYEFEVRYIPDFSSGKAQQISIGVKVKPYFWKSWWFITLIVALLVFVIVRWYSYRVRQLRKREAVALFQPIEEALRESKDPKMLQDRIKTIISNQKLYNVSLSNAAKEEQAEQMKKNQSFMDRLIKCMEANYANSEFGIPDLCYAMGMSRQVITKQLKEETGKTPTQFMRDYRLDMSRRLIVSHAGKVNIADVAYRVGFNDPKYFTRCFTKRYTVSPTAFREQVLNGEATSGE